MTRPFRIAHWALALVIALGFGQPMATLGSTPVPDGMQVYVGHGGRMTALIPDSWRVPPTAVADYQGDDGFVLSYALADNGTGDACAAFATSETTPVDFRLLRDLTAEPTRWRNGPACALSGTIDGPAKGLVVPLPEPFVAYGVSMSFGVLLADAGHFGEIAETIDLTDARLTPRLYLSSVIDIIEARAWWSPQVDWESARNVVLPEGLDLPTYDLAILSVERVLTLLRGQGDDHSFIVQESGRGRPDEASGAGMIVGGGQVLAVFPDGPADRAGLQRGDVIQTVNGFAVSDEFINEQFGFGGWPVVSELVVQRPGQAGTFEVTITRGAYATYLPPTGERLGENLGYIEIDQFTVLSREHDYAEAGNAVLRDVDSPAVCGWIVDLRLNAGGSYGPMISAVGPILGNGPFWGDAYRDGTAGTMVSYSDGALVYADGTVRPDYVAAGTRYQPAVTAPPVAVLTSANTASAGEVASVAFVGRENTRLFGEQTAGRTVGNTGYLLWDGTQLRLAETAYIDRNGTVYTDGVMPDVQVASDWTSFRTEDDPVIAAASAWLLEQPGCGATATPVG